MSQSRPRTWTTEQVKAAFWATFHQQGELWFPYPTGRNPDPDHGNAATEYEWNKFMEHLHEQA